MNPEVQEVERYSWNSGHLSYESDTVATETPVALVYNGVSHVVTMATPTNLPDMALGFSLSEGILDSPSQLLDCDLRQREQGLELAMKITSGAFAKLKLRRRNLTGRTGCGLCGVEALEQAIVAPAQVSRDYKISHEAIQNAVEGLARAQSLKRSFGGVHGAAWCSVNGSVELLREDVGRHNALDKLIGSLHQEATSTEGFVLVTSRASYEMVAKVASQNIPLLAAMSSPTSLAIQQADEAGLTLVAYAQSGRQVVFAHAEKFLESPDHDSK